MTFGDTVRFVAQREYVRTVRRRGFRFATLLIPLLLGLWVLFFGFITGDDPVPDRLVVVNQSTLPLASTEAPAGPSIDVVDRSDASERLSAGEVDAVYIVPADIASGGVVQRVVPPDTDGISSLLGGESAQLQAVLSAYLRAAMLQELGVPAEAIGQLLQDPPIETVAGFDGEPVEGEVSPGSILAPYAFALIFVLSIFTSAGYLLQSVAAEKENRVVEILLSTVSPLALLLGKILGLGAAGLTQIGVWAVAGIAALLVAGDAIDLVATLDLPPEALAIALAYFVGGYLLYAAAFSAIGAAMTGIREAQQLSSFGAIFGSLPIILTVVFMEDPMSPIAVVLTLIPFTAPAAALQVIAFSGSVPWALISASLVILAIADVVAIVIAGRLFQASLLLSGTRPSFQRLARTLVSG